MSSANRVGEIFTAAGTAFTKLGELTIHLHGVSEPNPTGHKWDEDDVEQLRGAIRRFSEDLNKLTETIKNKSNTHIKGGIKRKMYDDAGVVAQGPGSSNGSIAKKPVTTKSPATAKVITKPTPSISNNSSYNNSYSADSETNDSFDT